MSDIVITKVCTRCNAAQPLKEFYFSGYKGRRHTQCRICRNEKMKEYRKAQHPYDRKRRTRNSNLKRKFGITIDEYDEMLFGQGGKCKICQVSYTTLSQELNVDHNHSTGQIRGLLCSKCNTLVGYLEKNKHLLEVAEFYIKTSGSC